MDGKKAKSTSVECSSSYQNFVSMVSVYSHHHGWVVRHQVMENKHKKLSGSHTGASSRTLR
jgi:hypothetical protein